MRILKKPKWSKKFTCKACQSELLVEESDLRGVNTAMAYAGETWDPHAFFTCPVCHTRNYVTNEIPSGIQERLFEQISTRRK